MKKSQKVIEVNNETGVGNHRSHSRHASGNGEKKRHKKEQHEKTSVTMDGDVHDEDDGYDIINNIHRIRGKVHSAEELHKHEMLVCDSESDDEPLILDALAVESSGTPLLCC